MIPRFPTASRLLRILFIHGLESGPNGTKSRILRNNFVSYTPQMNTRDIKSCVRTIELAIKLFDPHLIGCSSFGYCVTSKVVDRGRWKGPLLILAPALHLTPNTTLSPDINTVIVHGTKDELIPIEDVRTFAKTGSSKTHFIEVIDDHALHNTVKNGNLPRLVNLTWTNYVKDH